MNDKLKLGLAALVLTSCATYKSTVLEKERVGKIVHKENSENYGTSDSRLKKYELSVMILLKEKNFIIQEYIDPKIFPFVEEDSTVNLTTMQYCKIKYRRKEPKDTTGYRLMVIKDMSLREYNPLDKELFKNLNRSSYLIGYLISNQYGKRVHSMAKRDRIQRKLASKEKNHKSKSN